MILMRCHQFMNYWYDLSPGIIWRPTSRVSGKRSAPVGVPTGIDPVRRLDPESEEYPGEFNLNRDFSKLFSSVADNIFLVKVAYWVNP